MTAPLKKGRYGQTDLGDIVEIPVGQVACLAGLLIRLGNPIDGKGPIEGAERRLRGRSKRLALCLVSRCMSLCKPASRRLMR